MGVNVIHFRDIDVKKNLNGVLDYLKKWIMGFCEGEHTPSLTTEKVVQINRSQEGEHTPSSDKIGIHPSQEGMYQGVKFKTVFKKKEVPSNKKIEKLKYWCRIFHKKNLAPPYPGGSFGNLSFRIRNGENNFIITGSRIGLKNSLANDSFVEVANCDFENKIIYANGTREPSSESMLHFAIYKARPDINAIFHGHCAELLENAGKLEIPTTIKEEPYGTIELVNSVLEIIDKNDMVMMKNHGFIALGKTMKEAGKITLKYLEKICKK
jgi:L-fuculose-phosphate aldolase